MQRTLIPLVTDWLYLPADKKAAAGVKFAGEKSMAKVSIPHTNVELPYNHFSEQEHCFVSWYRRRVKIPREAAGRRVHLDFAGVMIAATVFVNGKKAGPEHKGGYTPFSFDITDLVTPGKEAVIAVRVDSTERPDIPPFGRVVDYLTFGGIYREVQIRITDPIYIRHIFATPGDVLADRKRLDVVARVVNTTNQPRTLISRATLKDAAGKTLRTTQNTVSVMPKAEVDEKLWFESLAGISLWDIDSPALYRVEVSLEDDDAVSERIGFRTAEFRDDGAFYLNGRAIKLRGVNRHQTYAYVGQAGPARMQRKDADIIKHDLACNIVRTSHYPQSVHFLDRCDEIGLLVLEEIPGWQFIGDADWQQLALRDVRAMIERDRNRPAIILWGVRINESGDNHDFYTATNALAHQLDPSRQTSGIRCIWNSELLEDVYTMNDFGYDLKPPAAPKYMNTEFCGHMYPTKTFDQEERALQHALHHAHIHNQIGGMPSAGGIGWCAFDYNTHHTFGSGDRICYHGVMDMFRQPKLATHFYASQEDPAKRVVLELGGYWTRGDRSGGGSDPQVVFTNCDKVELFVGAESRGTHEPDRTRWPNLPHPPVYIAKIGGQWGDNWKPLTIVGYLAGKEVVRRQYSQDPIARTLVIAADDKRIDADGGDMTRVSLQIVDDCGNISPFAQIPVQLTITGPGVLVGDNPFPMPGGRGAVYVRSTRKAGKIVVTATAGRLKPVSVTITTK